MDKIKNLKKLDLTKKSIEGEMFAEVYKVLKGGFDIKGIETYIGSAKVGKLVKDIEVFERLTEDKSWPVSSIIQREIDNRRVKQISEEYILKTSNNVKYFPPIIIAIVPKEKDTDQISKKFEIQEEEDKTGNEVIFKKGKYPDDLNSYFEEAENLSRLEGFYVLDWLEGSAHCALSWEKDKVYAIVIDGQHRLEALKYSIEKESKVLNYNQDIVFLDLSKKANIEDRSPAEAVRRIFIDINYNAKQVSNARRTLMDDKDLSSLIVQSLVNDDDINGDRKEKFLKPQLVDWHSENLKHSFPQITGVLVLQQLIEDNLLDGYNLISLSDMRAPKKVEKFVNILKSKFKVDYIIENKVKYQGIKKIGISYNSFKKRRDEIASQGEDEDNKEYILFSMDYNVLNVARDFFDETYSKSIVAFFNNFYPYKEAIEILKENEVFNENDVRSRLIIKNPSKLNKEQIRKIKNISESMAEKLDDRFYLSYTVLGQKGFFKHYYKELSKYLVDFELTEQNVLSFTKDWLSRMETIIKNLSTTHFLADEQKFVLTEKIQKECNIADKGLISSSFWQGIIYNNNNIVYNKQGVDGFVGVLNYLYKVEYKDGNLHLPDDDIWDAIPYSRSRIKNKIKQEFVDYEESQIEDLTNNIWKAKLKFFKSILKENFDKHNFN